jgi:hypothetical protein
MAVMADTIDKIMANLNKEIAGIENRSMGGMLAAGLMVQGGAQKKVPVEHGNLLGSAFTRKAQDGSLAAEVGFSAASAVFVHENMEQKLKGKPRPSGLGKYWGPSGQPKFLESEVNEKQDKIVDVIASHARVKK